MDVPEISFVSPILLRIC